ncbi:YidC/Oxa1 family membrane protein insertase [Breznakiellaceae bacterium SP9]
MLDILYTLIIFPISALIETCYFVIFEVSRNAGLSIFGVSFVVSLCTLPLYFMAEKHEKVERTLRARLQPKIDKIKAVFSGDKQYMMLSTLYRQNHYHPVYALRNTFGLFIQIPFFIAAYSYLSQLETLTGTPFFFIRDLGAPDKLLSIGGGGGRINVLPILMTAINCISGTIYTKGFPLRDKLQLYGMALVFLVLLYNSPAALVLYWKFNNIFSLLKNSVQKIKNAKTNVLRCAFVFLFVFDVYLIFFYSRKSYGRWIFAGWILAVILSGILVSPFLLHILKKSLRNRGLSPDIYAVSFPKKSYILSSAILWLLIGIIIPSSLIASSVQEFCFIESYSSPFPFLFNTALQSAGIFLFWSICIFLLFPPTIQFVFQAVMAFFCAAAIADTFLVPESYGFLTTMFIFSEAFQYPATDPLFIWNGVLLAALFVVLFFVFLLRKKNILLAFQIIAALSFVGFGAVNIYAIERDYVKYKSVQVQLNTDSSAVQSVYSFTRSGKNTVVLFMDAAISSYVPFIFEEKPELLPLFSGFTWYPNCASFANHTMVGALPLYGGYEYTPTEVNKRSDTTLIEKQTEAYLLLPLLFDKAGFSVTITDPPFDNYQKTNLSIFEAYPQIHAENLMDKYTPLWLQEHPGVTQVSIATILKRNMLYFSFFKTAPLPVRLILYNNGNWLSTKETNTQGELTIKTLSTYALFDLLPQLTEFNNTQNSFMFIYELLPHEPAFLQAPDYVPAQGALTFNDSKFAHDGRYHVNIASFLMLGRWFAQLKENGVYDNTRIIIVADHGKHVSSQLLSNVILPNGASLQSFNPLLMVKDFNAQSDTLLVDNSFMTNADTPLLATHGIIPQPVNPFTNKVLQSDKQDGITVTTIGALSSREHSQYQYKIADNRWLRVHDNIFDSANWEAVSNPNN